MCFPAIAAAVGLGGATAAGATAAAGVASASTLSTLATLATIGGTVIQGISGLNAANQTRAEIAAQAETERQLTATQDARQRAQTMRVIRQQSAELAARGVSLDSPTAIALGQTAAQELAFDSQSIRAGGVARQQEFSSQDRLARANGANSILRGTFGAAGQLLTAAPDLWPGFLRQGGAA
ncbi:hypothetical protein [Rhodoferax sp.]|uniref:hypothetical protein n=1 Tax=Rhodoferax sp. TaxID=50421 RepID=UPI002ACD94A9|nr:hypothetical protein [Rhodoferax sp.]MDZ7919988.1 hypothetical protein [Rhodoferax sp.]